MCMETGGCEKLSRGHEKVSCAHKTVSYAYEKLFQVESGDGDVTSEFNAPWV